MVQGVDDSSMKAGFSRATVVLVDGLFGMGINSAVVKHLEERFEGARIIKLSCGGVSSVRDRACECFYQLKGGTIDYELEDFELEAGHGRWGTTEEGRFVAWGEDNPVILVGYSLGAPTARYLHHLLAKQVLHRPSISQLFPNRAFPLSLPLTPDQCQAFRRPDGTRIETSASWVSTILTINGVNNGTVAVHAVGLGRDTLEPVCLTILWWIFTAIYVIVWIDIPYLDRACGLRLEHWEARRRHGVSLFRLLTWRPGTQDNAGRDLCPERARALNEEMASTLDARIEGTRHIAAYSFCTLKMPEKLTTSIQSLSRRHMPNYRMIFRVPYCVFLIPFALIIGISSWAKVRFQHVVVQSTLLVLTS